MKKRVKWNKKKCFKNLAIIAYLAFLFYEFICYLNEVLIRCAIYYN